MRYGEVDWHAKFGPVECLCGAVVKRKTANQVHCSQKCLSKSQKIRHKDKVLARRRAVLGRICTECLASDDEVVWSLNKTLCAACEKGRRTGYVCPKCDKRMNTLGCIYCTSATLGRVDVKLISKKTEQVKIVRRHAEKSGKKVSIRFGGYGNYKKLDPNDPVIWLSHEKWLGIRV